MATQIHKKFSNEQVKELMQKYLNKEVERKYIQEIFGIGKSRFFEIIQTYRANPDQFSVDYKRSGKTRSIAPEIKDNIIKELSIDKKAIQNKDIPLYKYNYSYIQKRLNKKYGQSVGLSTVIRHARANKFCLPKRPKQKTHDREVLTNNIGELIQHDASYHLWAPDAGVKWVLITSLDDHSRFMFYAKLIDRESSWDHIEALQSVVIKYGTPLAYYTDCHSIFPLACGDKA